MNITTSHRVDLKLFQKINHGVTFVAISFITESLKLGSLVSVSNHTLSYKNEDASVQKSTTNTIDKKEAMQPIELWKNRPSSDSIRPQEEVQERPLKRARCEPCFLFSLSKFKSGRTVITKIIYFYDQ